MLKALEHVGVRWLRLDPQFYNRVRFDCGDFRASRLAELRLSAEVAAERVRQTHEAFRFNPMGARDRRIIHLALKDQPGVRTSSEGQGEMRQVVIFPADQPMRRPTRSRFWCEADVGADDSKFARRGLSFPLQFSRSESV